MLYYKCQNSGDPEFNSEDSPFIDYLPEDVTGPVHLRLAGESTAFSFGMVKNDYESFVHQ